MSGIQLTKGSKSQTEFRILDDGGKKSNLGSNIDLAIVKENPDEKETEVTNNEIKEGEKYRHEQNNNRNLSERKTK